MRFRSGVAAIASMTCVSALHAQTRPAVPLPRTEIHELAAKSNGQSYRISVSLPESYAQNPTARYPAIYVTDADWVFGITAQTQYLLRLDNAVPDALVVGISRSGPTDVNIVGAVRSFDLSPTRDLGAEKIYLNRYKRETPTGGAAAFLRVFLDELIPDIERTYRTNGDRTYIGYSLGGLFGAYALFQSPDTFGRMILVSPSLMWDDDTMLKQEAAYAAGHKQLHVRLFMSAGEFETPEMVSDMRTMANALTAHYPGVELSTKIFEGERHLSTFPVAVTRGLKIVFAEKPKT